ncbi:hypothetical protein V6N12_046626 [Hibiscus sabdariffa]|uniref:Uncharacterized protein n=1 Tax=Hibiscus sabdariffa TaxID=183260 RepID=A0ABR2DJM0_9ROSI
MYGSSKFVTQEMTGAIIPALMHGIPSELRSLACLGESSTRMGDLLGSRRVAPLFLNSAFKRAWARIVLGWVTSGEVLELHVYFWFGNGRFSDIALVGAAYKDGVMYGSSKFVTLEMTVAIIPALMHRIPSEIRSEACLGESSTRMGDLLEVLVLHPYFLFGNGVSVTSNSAIKRAWARVVLGWVTCWEVLVLHPYFWFGKSRFSVIALVGAAYKDGVMYGSSKFVTQGMTGAIIPALMHRMPSELRS